MKSEPAYKELNILDLGVRDFQEIYDLQKKLLDQKKTNPSTIDHLLLVEHPDVYTGGRATDDGELPDGGFFIERGGRVTFHTLGQLVFYPILKLSENERDLHKYLRALEDTVFAVLGDYGLEGERREGATGVWIRGKKVASIGVAVSGWVTYHGVALNVNNSLEGFQAINPCGFSGDVMTSLQALLGAPLPMSEVKEKVRLHFCEKLHRQSKMVR